jgi:hypothetical protein
MPLRSAALAALERLVRTRSGARIRGRELSPDGVEGGGAEGDGVVDASDCEAVYVQVGCRAVDFCEGCDGVVGKGGEEAESQGVFGDEEVAVVVGGLEGAEGYGGVAEYLHCDAGLEGLFGVHSKGSGTRKAPSRMDCQRAWSCLDV